MSETGNQMIPSIPLWGFSLLVTPFMLALCQLREIKLLMDYSFVGVVAVLFAMLCVLGSCIETASDHGVAPNLMPGFDFANMAEFFGIMFFSMEGIQVMLPVVHSLENPRADSSRIINVVVIFACLVFFVVGFAGYLAYGVGTKAPITLNIHGDAFMDMVRVVQAVSVLMTAPLQAFPVSEMMDASFPDYPTTIRVTVVLIPVILAMACPHMAEALGIIGGVCVTGLAVVIPGFMYLKCFEARISTTARAGVLAAIVFSAVFGGWATVLSMVKLVQKSTA
jgi:amino acid permease